MRKIDYHYNTSFRLRDEEEYTEWVISVIQKEGHKEGRLMYAFCDDSALLEMNKDFLGHDYYTDILTFPGEGPGISGEIYISVDRIEDNADTYGVALEEELRRVMIHGVLHLMGYKDGTPEDRKRMRQKEDESIQMFHVKH